MDFDKEKFLFSSKDIPNPDSLFNSVFEKRDEDSENLFTKESIKNSEKIYNPIKRINGIDTSILENSAFLKLEDEDFKIDKKIEYLEFQIDIIEDKLIVAKALKAEDEVSRLLDAKKTFTEEIKKLNPLFSHKNRPQQVKKIRNKIKFFKYRIDELKVKLAEKLIGSKLSLYFMPILRKMKFKSALERLNKIHKNIDELINQKIPYGERDIRMEMIAQNIKEANHINNRLSKKFAK